MRQLRRSLMRRALHLMVMVSFVAGVFAAGRSYFFCRMLNEVQAQCCCAHDSRTDGNASIEESTGCCELRTHDASGTTTAPSVHVATAADVAPSLTAPVALVPRAGTKRVPLADWTGPPLDKRRALISVRLL